MTGNYVYTYSVILLLGWIGKVELECVSWTLSNIEQGTLAISVGVNNFKFWQLIRALIFATYLGSFDKGVRYS